MIKRPLEANRELFISLDSATCPCIKVARIPFILNVSSRLNYDRAFVPSFILSVLWCVCVYVCLRMCDTNNVSREFNCVIIWAWEVSTKCLKPTRIYSVWICHVPYLSPSFFFLSTPDRPSKREKNVIAIPAREPLLWKNTLTNSVVKGERCVRATVRRQFIYLISLHSSFRSYQSRHQRSVSFPLPNFWYQASFYAINFIQVFLDTFNRSLLLIVYKFQLKFNLFQLN